MSGVVVASAGPYASLHLAPDRQPRQHPTTQFFTGRMPFLSPNQQRQSTEDKRVTIPKLQQNSLWQYIHKSSGTIFNNGGPAMRTVNWRSRVASCCRRRVVAVSSSPRCCCCCCCCRRCAVNGVEATWTTCRRPAAAAAAAAVYQHVAASSALNPGDSPFSSLHLSVLRRTFVYNSAYWPNSRN